MARGVGPADPAPMAVWRRRGLGEARADLAHMAFGVRDGLGEPLDLRFDLRARYVTARVRRPRVSDDQRRADGHAGASRDALEDNAARRARVAGRRSREGGGTAAHPGSPKRSAMRLPIACTHSAARSPLAWTSTTVPLDPHSKSTPITLLAFALWSSRAISTSQGYFDASWTSLVAARACKPS